MNDEDFYKGKTCPKWVIKNQYGEPYWDCKDHEKDGLYHEREGVMILIKEIE